MEAGVLVSTPDLRPSLFSVLAGLDNEKLLGLLVTTIAHGDSRPGISRVVKGVVPKSILGPWLRRSVPDNLVGKTRLIPCRELVRLFASRVATPEITHVVWSWSEYGFDRAVAARYAGRYSLVYGMEHSSLDTFRTQKQAGGCCVLRQVNAHGRYVQKIMKEEMSRFPELATSYSRKVLNDSEQVLARKEEEYREADFIVVNSDFVRSTFLRYGIEDKKLYSVQTGCPPVSPTLSQPGRSDVIRFLYVGTVGLRKGFQYLLAAWDAVNSSRKVELHVAGPTEFPSEILGKNRLRIRYHGKIGKKELSELYQRCDVFVLPTLCEGLAHSVLEALSFGLPVITTEESGCARLVVSGENGFLVKSGDVDSLRFAMERCIAAKSDLPGMGQSSLEKARRWTVDESNKRHLHVIEEILESSYTGGQHQRKNIDT